ncbi:MAG: hypothetical protein ONB44_20955 [candidate division KSB1 bacterium]|nr:hypothetical protein [candidate division KSB1 bacterium]MDZ7304603.1 hypothetical protein [candidate division KSB1 bacterium]
MRKRNVAVVMLLAALFLVTIVNAQDFSSKTIQSNYQVLSKTQQGMDDFDEQIKSILKLFSSLVGSGFVNTASLHHVGGIDVGVRGVFAKIPDEFKQIVPSNVSGVKDPWSGTNLVPLPFLHGSLGLPANFEVMAKFFTFPLADEPGGNITLLGGAVKYGLLKDNLALPAITVLAGYQTILVPEDYAFGTVSTLSLKGYISKNFSIATLYAGGGIDRTALTIDIPGIITRDYNLVYPNGTVGLTISPLPLFKVNADFNFGEVKNFTAGVGLSIR